MPDRYGTWLHLKREREKEDRERETENDSIPLRLLSFWLSARERKNKCSLSQKKRGNEK